VNTPRNPHTPRMAVGVLLTAAGVVSLLAL
jgi:hypothetical protein